MWQRKLDSKQNKTFHVLKKVRIVGGTVFPIHEMSRKCNKKQP